MGLRGRRRSDLQNLSDFLICLLRVMTLLLSRLLRLATSLRFSLTHRSLRFRSFSNNTASMTANNTTGNVVIRTAACVVIGDEVLGGKTVDVW